MPRKGVVSIRKCWKCWIVWLLVDLGQFSIQNPTYFSRNFWIKTSLTVVYGITFVENFQSIPGFNLQGWDVCPCQVEVYANGQSKSNKILNFTNIDDMVSLEFDQSISNAYHLPTSRYCSVNFCVPVQCHMTCVISNRGTWKNK